MAVFFVFAGRAVLHCWWLTRSALWRLVLRIGGRPYDRVEPPGGTPTAAAAFGAGRRVENVMERLVATIGQLEGLEDDVDRSALVVGRVVNADRPTIFAHVLFVFGFNFHNLAEHTPERVS